MSSPPSYWLSTPRRLLHVSTSYLKRMLRGALLSIRSRLSPKKTHWVRTRSTESEGLRTRLGDGGAIRRGISKRLETPDRLREQPDLDSTTKVKASKYCWCLCYPSVQDQIANDWPDFSGIPTEREKMGFHCLFCLWPVSKNPQRKLEQFRERKQTMGYIRTMVSTTMRVINNAAFPQLTTITSHTV